MNRLAQLIELLDMVAPMPVPSPAPAPDSPFQVGQAYLFRLVMHYWTGRVVSVGETEIVIEDAAWIANTGRFADAITTGSLEEVEPVPGNVILGRGALVDAVVWAHELPREQK